MDAHASMSEPSLISNSQQHGLRAPATQPSAARTRCHSTRTPAAGSDTRRAHDLFPRGDAAAAEPFGRPPPRLQLPGAFRGGAPQRLRQRREVAKGRRDGLPVAPSPAGLRTGKMHMCWQLCRCPELCSRCATHHGNPASVTKGNHTVMDHQHRAPLEFSFLSVWRKAHLRDARRGGAASGCRGCHAGSPELCASWR